VSTESGVAQNVPFPLSPRFLGRPGALKVEVNPNRFTIVALVVEQLHAAIRPIQDMDDSGGLALSNYQRM